VPGVAAGAGSDRGLHATVPDCSRRAPAAWAGPQNDPAGIPYFRHMAS